MSTPSCSRCHTGHPTYGVDGLCHRCLSAAVSLASTPMPRSLFDEPLSDPEPSRFQPGDHCGLYRIVRLIGRGATGEVYEAEHTDNGRRLALKVLHRRLRRSADRVRFLAEGRAAAAAADPNRVYVFEAVEIAGLPLLAMELVPGETLAAHVRRLGPLQPQTAVAQIQQVIDGLEAGYLAGVLHRDIKPGNCFLDAHGQVKVGDFGLATIAARPRDEAAPADAALFVGGTPEFAAPEQLTGDRTDLRSDIYAVGATLFFLLTGRPPFAHPEITHLVEQVTTQPISWPEYPQVPAGLRAAVNRCLAKNPAERFVDYAELRSALHPFSPDAEEPATLARRAMALALDTLVLLPLLGPIVALLVGSGVGRSLLDLALIATILLALYRTIAIATRGATVGMRLLGLRVTAGAGEPPPWPAAALRGSVLVAPFISAKLATLLLVVPGTAIVGASLIALAVAGLPLVPRVRSTAAPLSHDRLTRTRVTRQKPPRHRHAAATAAPDLATSDAHIGPFAVVRELRRDAHGTVWDAWDAQLRRRVWIHEVPVGTPPLGEHITHANRPTALRWLQGHRSGTRAWDAFEAIGGEPLASIRGAEWPSVAVWLLDLTRELVAREPAGQSATLNPDSIWVTSAGHGVLLDIPASSAGAVQTPAATATPTLIPAQQALAHAARLALGTREVALPPRVQAHLDALARNQFLTLADAATALEPLTAIPDRVTSRIRLQTLLLSGATWGATGLLLAPLLRALLAVAPQFTAAQPIVLSLLIATAAAFSGWRYAGGVWLSTSSLLIVDPTGQPVTRAKAALRALLAWSWLVLLAARAAPLSPQVGMLLVLALWYTISHPSHGVVDRLIGTQVVPR
jgi:eukaryotic-like serine/threonine-protein kinase